ncbi:AAA family ATPase [Paenibacillus oryzisoli]|uniref:AAA family ATPase n=1 Tax=Paenibacillus oryzisoli TaxID=1850517 RepID=UPI003D281464
MRIVAIEVDGFGSLRERRLTTESALVVFYGANEAGKSTLMGFVRAVLFGFPTRQQRAERYEPLGGGAHGGALTLEDDQGQRIRVERYDVPAAGGRRAAAGHVRVVFADGRIGGEAELGRLLGGLSADLYRSLFAFGLSELQELRTLQTDELSGYLYSAGLGVSGSAIMEAERKLTAQADGLYRPRGRNQEMNLLLKELEGLEQLLRRRRDEAAGYGRLREERRSAAVRIAALEEQQAALRAGLEQLALAGKARSGWLRWRQLGRELEGLPARPGFPAQATARLEALEAELERLQGERAKLELRRGGLRSELQGIQRKPEVLAHQTELNHLLEQVPTYEAYTRQREQLRVEAAQLTAHIRRQLASVDLDWEEPAILNFPITIALREQARLDRERLRKQADAELRMEAELDQLYEQERRLQEQAARLAAELERSGAGSMGVGGVAGGAGQPVDPASELAALTSDYARWQLASRELRYEQERQQAQRSLEDAAKASKASARRLMRRLMLLAGVLTLALPAVLLWQGALPAAIATFVVLAVATGYIGFGTREQGQRSSRAMSYAAGAAEAGAAAAEADLQALELRLAKGIERMMQQGAGHEEAAAGREGRSSSGNGAIPLDSLQPYLDAWQREAEGRKAQYREQLRKWDGRKDTEERLLALHAQIEQRSQLAERLHKEKADAEKAWSAWLHGMNIPAALSPDSFLETLQTLGQVQETLRQRGQLEAKLATMERYLAQFEAQAAALLDRPLSGSDAMFALKRWKEQEADELAGEASIRQLEQAIRETEEALALTEQTKERTQSRLHILLQEGGAEDGEQLRQLECEQLTRTQLVDEQRLLEGSLESLLGSLPAADRLFAELGDVTEEGLAARSENVQQQLAELTAETNELRERVGKFDGQLERLEQGAEQANERLQAEALRTRLSQLRDDYAVASFASLLLKKARDVYEQQRQPGVLLRASAYFAEMTNGAFQAVKAPFGEQRLLAIRAGGQAVDTAMLSRGTAEQLYLAMRFALAEEYAGRAVLPLVMDDILVNFDEARMAGCLRVLADLSKRHQVLLFTCHAHVREAAASLIPNHLSISL